MAPDTVGLDNGYEYRRKLIIGIGATLIALMVVIYGLRLYARRISRANFWWDDWIMSGALVLSIASTVVEFLSLQYGLGKHAEGEGVTKEDLKYYIILLYVFEILSTTAIAIIKTSMLLFYHRLFPSRTFRYAIYAVQSFVIASFVMIFFGVMFQCTPIAFYWDKTIDGHCINISPFYISVTVVNLAADVMIVTMPMPIVWRLNTSAGRKIGLTFVFVLGGFTCVASILRIVTLTKVDTEDITYSNYEGALWSFVECDLGFIAANLPMIWPLVGNFLRKMGLSQRFSRDKISEDSKRKSFRNQDPAGFKRMRNSSDGAMSKKNSSTDPDDAMWLEMGMPPHAIAVKTDLHQTVEGETTDEEERDPSGAVDRNSWISQDGLPRAI